jgi:prolyl oligopeptidase
MKFNFIISACFFFFLISCKKKEMSKSNLAPKIAITTEYHNQKVNDSYRYMENLKDSIFLSWVKEQETHTKEALNSISNRKRLLDKISSLDKKNTATFSLLKIIDNNTHFYLKKEGTSNTAILYKSEGFKGKEIELFDPKTYAPNTKEKYSINYIQPSWDGKKIAISITSQDKEISEIIILDIPSKTRSSEVIKNCWPSGIGGIHWLPDNSGFIYTHIPEIDKNSKNYILNTASVIYTLGDSPKNSKTLFSKTNNPELDLKSKDFCIIYFWNQTDKYLIAKVGGIGFKDYYYAPVNSITNKKIQWKPLFKKKHQIKQFSIANDSLFYKTSKNASNYKVCKTALANLNFENPEIIVEEDKNAVITDFALTKNGLFYVKTKNGVEAKLYHFKENKEQNIPIPKASGSINLTSKNSKSKDLWIEIEGWTNNEERYYYNDKTGLFTEENLGEIVEFNELNDVIIEEIEVTSHDGVKVPLSIMYKKGLKFNSENRLLITGYGAYGISDVPYLDKYMLHWLNEGGIYASAHVRGGGEKGNKWHKGGYKTTKSNTWKDFIACTEYLFDKKYSSPKKTAIWSGSAGGILIGRAITERPDLYAAAFIRVGMLNALRSETGYNGANNTKEFGTFKDAVEFKALLEMDAFQHIKKGVKYPAVYLTAGMNDARVPAWQPAKFAARMQEATVSEKPVLLSVDFEGGHGFDASVNKKNEELVDVLSFFLWQTEHPDYQPEK